MPATSVDTLIIGFPEYRTVARKLAGTTGFDYADAQVHRFPDGESKIRLPDTVPEHVILCRSLYQPNDKLIELELATTTARKLGARHLTLVAPYLAYLRQDKAFHPGEAVSQQIIGSMLAHQFDALVTVDPHLHRIDTLQQAVPLETVITLNATQPMAEFLKQHIENPLLIGPDQESEQWVSAIAEFCSFEYVIATKQRFSDRDVAIQLPEHDYSNRHLVLIDDIASTGRTLEETAHHINTLQPASISVMVTHAVFVDDAVQRLSDAGIGLIVSSDSIPHPSNQLSLIPILADSLLKLMQKNTRLTPATCAV